MFTLAPDPHAVIHALDMTGALTRAPSGRSTSASTTGSAPGWSHRLAAGADHCALFPRPRLRDQLRDLLGVDIGEEPARYTVVPEGIDVSVGDAARASGALAGARRRIGGSRGCRQRPGLDRLDAADGRAARSTGAGCRSR